MPPAAAGDDDAALWVAFASPEKMTSGKGFCKVSAYWYSWPKVLNGAPEAEEAEFSDIGRPLGSVVDDDMLSLMLVNK
jgi:hypothetical protein